MRNDPSQLITWLSMLFDDAQGAIERRTLCNGAPAQRWHLADADRDTIARLAITANQTAGTNVYFGTGTRSAVGKCGNANVIGTYVVFVEFDGPGHKNGGHLKSTTPAEMIAEVRQKLEAHCFPEPTMIVFSGGGVHVYWKFDSFFTDLDRYDDLVYRIVETLGGDFSCTNRERIMRAPGTWNYKSEAMATIVSHSPALTYTYDDLACVVIHGNTKDDAPAPVAERVITDSIDIQAAQRSRSGMSVIDEFCTRVDVRDLARADGATFVSDKYRRPGKDDAGFSGLIRKNKAGRDVLCTWSENDPANDRKFGSKKGQRGSMAIHDSFSYFCLTRHKGDMKAAIKAAAALLGIKPPPQKLDAQVMHEIAESEHCEAFDALLFGTYASDADYLRAQAKAASIVSKFTTNPKQLSRIISLLVTPEPAGACA